MSSSTNVPGVIAATMIVRSPLPAKRLPQGEFLSPAEVVSVPARSPSPRRLPQAASSSGLGGCSPGIANFRSCCEDLINFDDYPNISAHDRAVIYGFMNGDLLRNDKWRTLFPSGKFECTLQASSESPSDDFGCKEKIVFKIDFQKVACSKNITRRVWSSKTKVADTGSEIGSESPMKTSSYRSNHSRKRAPKQRRASFPEQTASPTDSTPKRSTSYPGSLPTRRATPKRSSGSDTEYSPIELQSPIKQAPKATPKTSGKKRGRPPSNKTTPAKQTKTSVKKTKAKAEQDQVWSVSSVLDHKVEGGKHFFLVRWEGLNEKGKPWDDTWEPKQNISSDLIAEYWSEHPKKKTKRSGGRKAK